MKAKFLRVLLPMAMILFMTSCSSDSDETVSAAVAKVESYSYNSQELELMDRINHYRVSQGLSVLEPIEHISYKSAEHNSYMIQNQVVGHYYFEQRSNNIKQVLGASRVSENIAYNYNTNAAAFNAWLNSEGHKENIEGDYTHFGVSIKINPENGRKYYTNIFMKR